MNPSELFDVKGLVTVVTGAASGIGLGYAEVMARCGAKVTLTDINPTTLAQAVERLAAEGCDVAGEVVDVADRPRVSAMFDDVVKRHGKLDVVFVNAGIDPGPGFLTPDGERNPEGALENIPDEQWNQGIEINLNSVFTTIRAAVRHMRPRQSGKIIVTTSNAAIVNEAIVGTAYMPAKAGAASLVRQAALELARFNIQVNAIAPGPFITNIGGGRLRNPEDRKAFEDRTPMRRIADVDEIKGLALFLASRASSYVTGAQIVIDGGMMLGMAD